MTMEKEPEKKFAVSDIPKQDQEIRIQPTNNGWLLKSFEGWFSFNETAKMLEQITFLAKKRRP